MSLLFDRPWPIKYEYKGNQLQIAFRYPDDSDASTHAVILSREDDVEIYIYDIVEGQWGSYEHAVKDAKAAQ